MTGAYLTLSGIYTVLASPAPTTNTFAIDASWGAQATVSGINEGNLAGAAYLVYWNPQIAGLSSPSGTSFPSSPGNNPAIYPNVSAEDWSLANFGQNLIANAMNGPLFYWNPLNAGTGATASFYAQIIPNAPALATGFFIAMPQQMIVAYGAAINQGTIPATYAGRVAGYAPGQVQDPMQVAWCDAGSLNTWIASASNQAGSFRLTRGSKIVGGIQGPQQAMLFTDVGVWVMAYIGYPDVWGFNEIAQGCGLIAKDAAGVRGPQVFWMSLDGFWAYAQGAVQKLPCDVWDIVFTNLNLAKDSNGNYLYLHHIRFAANSGFDEVAWHFPSAATLIQQTTTSSTAVGVSVLNLASTVGVQVGMTVADVTNPAAIGYITTVTAVTASTVTLRSPVTSPGVSSGDTIYFNNAENDSYVKLNTTTGEWDYALSVAQPGLASPTPIQVTAWLDANIYGHPLSSMMNPVWMQLSPAYVQPYSMLVQHEESPDAVTQTPSGVWGAAPITWMITTGYFQLAEAETFVFVDYVLPDFKWRRFPQGQSTSATVQFTLYVADYPDDPNYPAVAYGPYTVTNVGLPGAASPPVPNAGFEPRCRGRYFYAVIWGNDLGSFARLGGVKFRFQPDGRAP